MLLHSNSKAYHGPTCKPLCYNKEATNMYTACGIFINWPSLADCDLSWVVFLVVAVTFFVFKFYLRKVMFFFKLWKLWISKQWLKISPHSSFKFEHYNITLLKSTSRQANFPVACNTVHQSLFAGYLETSILIIRPWFLPQYKYYVT